MPGTLREIVSKTAQCIDRFSLIDPARPVVVALSGGKDSTVLCLALRELEVQYVPVVVDVGHEPHWGPKIADMVKPYGIEPLVVDLRRPTDLSAMPGIRLRLEVLDAGPKQPHGAYTPCTYCHGAKLAALQQIAEADGIDAIALGQHQTDAVASMIKEGLMQIDCGRDQRRTFSRQRFRCLVDQFGKEATRFPNGETCIIEAISALVDRGTVDTDEPPRQEISPSSRSEIIRPMFGVTESEIMQARDSLRLMTAGSGCAHGLHEETHTPREMIHYGVLQTLDNPAFDAWASQKLHSGITSDGRGKVGARLRRAELTGPHYKPVESGLDKYSRRA